MTEEQLALARRAVACKGWRWMPGMAIAEMGLGCTSGLFICDHGRVLDVRDDDGMQMVSASEYPYDDDGIPEYRWADATHVPDLTDPATLGCLLALVREAWNADWIYVVCDQMNDPEDGGYLWRVCVPWASDIVAPTEAEALVAALEAAP